MSNEAFTGYLDDLSAAARAASAEEERFRREAALQAEELKSMRAFAWRRLNLLRALGAALAEAEDEAAAERIGREVLYRETGLNGATQARREMATRFLPVTLAIWAAVRPEPEEEATADCSTELQAFEAWYSETRDVAFLELMEREIVELPLVEV